MSSYVGLFLLAGTDHVQVPARQTHFPVPVRQSPCTVKAGEPVTPASLAHSDLSSPLSSPLSPPLSSPLPLLCAHQLV